MENPFETITKRLSNIEGLLIDIKHKPGETIRAPFTIADPDELLTPEETAQLLKVSKVTVWQWSKPTHGILNPRRIGNQVRYLRSEVMAAARPTKGSVAA